MNYLQLFHVIQANTLCLLWFILQLRITTSTPPPGFVKKPDSDLHPPRYEFGYEVRDGGGGHQGHLEARDGVFALGKYYVKLPDGSDQKVNYFADDWGYHPLVEYNSASPSSSSSAQFAMGEKAVAALVKTLSEAKPTEVTNILQRLSHKEPLPSGSSSSLPPGEPIKYSNTLTSSKTSELSDSVEPEQYFRSHLTQPYAEQQTHIVAATAETPTTFHDSHLASVPRFTTQQIHSLNYHTNVESRFRSPEYTTVSDFDTNFPQEHYLNFESKKYNYVGPQTVTSNYLGETLKETTERVVTIGGNSGYKSEPKKISNSGSYREGQKGSVRITSYLANNEAAVDVSPNGENKRLPSVPGPDSGGATTISAFLIAEDDRKNEYNEIGSENRQKNIVVTTTPAPSYLHKESFGPIIVPNQPTISSATYYIGHLSSTTEPIQYQSSEEVNLSESYSRLNSSHTEEKKETIDKNEKTSENNGNELPPTPAPTPEPVLVTPREEAAQLTSSDQVLAPIQAVVSLSASTSRTEAETKNQEYESEKPTDSMEPIVEQQTLKESVYKTTIDVQKSIPFEITENNYEMNDAQTQSNQPTSPPYQQGTYLPIHESINNEFGKNQHQQNLPNNNNEFIQKVLMAYQKLSNVNDNSHIANHQNIQAFPTQTPSVVPNNLYYLYLQSYNPLINRYGVRPPQQVFYQLPYQTTLPPQNPTTFQNGYLYNSINSPYRVNQARAKMIHSSPTHFNYPTYINYSDFGQKYYPDNVDKNTHNGEDVISNFNNEFGVKSKYSIPPAYNVQVIKEEENNEGSVGYTDGSQMSLEESKMNEQNKHRYLDGPLNTIYVNNLNALSSNSYQKYVENTIGKTDENEQVRENGYVYNNPNQEFLSKDEFNSGNQGSMDNMGQTTQEQKYPEENILQENAHFEQYGIKIKNIPSQNPAELPSIPMKLQNTVAVTKLVPISAYPTPLPVAQPIALPSYTQPAHVPIPNAQFLQYPQVVPIPYKPLQPVYIYERNENADIQRKTIDSNSNQPPFRPSQKLYHSVYPPETYYVTEYLKTNSRTRGHGKKLCIEYGGFKPPLIPSIQIDEKLEQMLEKKSDKSDQN